MTIMYPGDKENGMRDRWVAVAPYNRISNLFSIVTVSPGNPPTAAYRDHERQGASVKSPHEALFPNAACKKCHQEGLIVPHREDVASNDDDRARFEALETKANSYEPQKHEGVPDPDLDLPPLGKDLVGVPECLARGSFPVEPSRKAVVLNSASCVDCHSGESAILPPFGKTIGTFIKSGIMPGHGELTDREKNRLAECLIDSYFQKPTFFNEWKDEGKRDRRRFQPEPPGALWKALSKKACLPVLDTRSFENPIEDAKARLNYHKGELLRRLHLDPASEDSGKDQH